MRNLDWESVLRLHPVFEMLDDAQRTAILSEDNSNERLYAEGERIVQQGELGTSIFLIGRGSAKVILERPDHEKVDLYTIGENEVFGEMALLENRPRAATLVASQRSILLEINGEAFLTILRESAETGLVLLQRMSRRLRVTDGMINEQRLCDHEDALALLSNKIESTIRTSDASLKASQTMYDQTSRRANEIIDSADRARNTMKWSLSTAAAVLALLGGLGLWDIKNMRSGVQADRAAVATARTELEAAQKDLLAKQMEQQQAFETARAELDQAFAELKTQRDAMDAGAAEAKEIVADLRRAADYVGEFTRSAEVRLTEAVEEVETTAQLESMLDDIKGMRITQATLDTLSKSAQTFEQEFIGELSGTLKLALVKNVYFHGALAPALDDTGLTNPDGRIFLTYYMALSALTDPEANTEYRDYKDALSKLIAFNPQSVRSYARASDRGLIKKLIKRSVQDEQTASERQVEADALINLVLSDS